MTPRRATKGEWAERLARKQYGPNDGGPLHRIARHYAEGRKDEHARAVRIIKALEKEVELDQHTYSATDKDFVRAIYRKVRLKLQRGR